MHRDGFKDKDAQAHQQEEGSLYEAALNEVHQLKQRFPVPIGNLVPHCDGLLLHEGALVSGETRRAYELGMMLRGLSPEAAGQGLEAHVESLQQWTVELLETGNVTLCVEATQKLALLCERKSE